jgi:hypothetical protein
VAAVVVLTMGTSLLTTRRLTRRPAIDVLRAAARV